MVYELSCTMCPPGVSYIGETARDFKSKFREHYANTISAANNSEPATHAVKTHGANAENNWNYKVLTSCADDIGRKISEANWIYKKKPCLNKKQGIQYVTI